MKKFKEIIGNIISIIITIAVILLAIGAVVAPRLLIYQSIIDEGMPWWTIFYIR